MIELLDSLFNGLAHLTSGMAIADYSKKKLGISKFDKRDKATYGFLGMFPDADHYLYYLDKYVPDVLKMNVTKRAIKVYESYILPYVGRHRGLFHMPGAEIVTGGLASFVYSYLRSKSLKLAVKNFIPGALSMASHFVIDLGSGGLLPSEAGPLNVDRPYLGFPLSVFYHAIPISISSYYLFKGRKHARNNSEIESIESQESIRPLSRRFEIKNSKNVKRFRKRRL